MKTQPRGAKTTTAPAQSQKEFKAAGIPGLAGATLPMQPQLGGAKPAIPRGAMASGRTLGKPMSTTKAAPAAAAPQQAQSATPAAGKTFKKTKASPATPPVVAPAPAPAPEVDLAQAKQSAENVDRETSLRRSAALEQLLESARRGAKVTLWRDLLKSSLGYWGNIRRGQVFLRDQLAKDITTALGLPDGWLDNPEFPPPTLAAWVMNADVPLPGAAAPASAASAKPKTPKAGARTLTAAASMQPPAPQAPEATPVAATPAPAPAPAQPAAPVAAAVAGMDWQPAADAQRVEKLGPLVTALVSVIQDLGLQGKLTEQDALKLLNGFMAKS